VFSINTAMQGARHPSSSPTTASCQSRPTSTGVQHSGWCQSCCRGWVFTSCLAALSRSGAVNGNLKCLQPGPVPSVTLVPMHLRLGYTDAHAHVHTCAPAG
jgi:hypothetical protein